MKAQAMAQVHVYYTVGIFIGKKFAGIFAPIMLKLW